MNKRHTLLSLAQLTIKDLVSELHDVVRWFQLGIYLDISPPAQEKIANYNDCNSQFFIGFATIVIILPWLYSILQQLYNAASCLHLHLLVNTFNTTLLQRLYNDWIQKQQNYNLSTCSSNYNHCIGTLMLYFIQCKSVANWLKLIYIAFTTSW